MAIGLGQDVLVSASAGMHDGVNNLRSCAPASRDPDPFKTARNVAGSFYATLLSRPPSLDEVAGLVVALSLDIAPSTKLTMLDRNGNVLGQARADTLLTQLPVFITLDGRITPGVQVPGGLGLNDGAQVAAFLLGMEATLGRIDQKTIAIYGEVASWLDQVGQQLLRS